MGEGREREVSSPFVSSSRERKESVPCETAPTGPSAFVVLLARLHVYWLRRRLRLVAMEATREGVEGGKGSQLSNRPRSPSFPESNSLFCMDEHPDESKKEVSIVQRAPKRVYYERCCCPPSTAKVGNKQGQLDETFLPSPSSFETRRKLTLLLSTVLLLLLTVLLLTAVLLVLRLEMGGKG